MTRAHCELAASVIHEFLKGPIWTDAVLRLKPKDFALWEQARIADIIEHTETNLARVRKEASNRDHRTNSKTNPCPLP
jgi:hypothetical protein